MPLIGQGEQLLEASRGEPTSRELDRQEIDWSQFVAV